jgi:hypothetical protein
MMRTRLATPEAEVRVDKAKMTTRRRALEITVLESANAL